MTERNPGPRTSASSRRRARSRSVLRTPWVQVDQYLEKLLQPNDAALRAALRTSRAAGLPPIQVSALQGRFLHLLARMQNPRRILEIGTLGGYSTIWLARAVRPGGQVISLELNPRHAAVARANLRRARLEGQVEVRVGPALESLAPLETERRAPFDLIFLDADKENNPEYLDWAIRLARPGSVIVVDNVVRKGEVAFARSVDPRVRGVRRMNAQLATEPRLLATTLQTVGVKGYDGFMMAIVISPEPRRKQPGRTVGPVREDRNRRRAAHARSHPASSD
jgi:predicted O-methyltransferase YrrM